MKDRIKVCKLPNGERTEEGSYWAKVDGVNIGVNGRTHWETESAARLAAEVYIATAEPTP
ncbi:hypothetical protein R5W24_000534 [Gemmata sp. JC717]|uniref:hypothetical protein n=1 Tax=Gemmata algarum TaxID=2975278 RepID=UPI0021BB3252|nr:hypothetical protein [Gemmata algarum]MDY3551458.1 hypothetical protein [Gemmata algarum]